MEKGTLILEGGASRGVFTAGVMDYFMDKELYFSHVVGVSAGACCAVDYLSKQRGRTRKCMIPMNKSLNYYNSIPELFRKRSLMDMELIFEVMPRKIYPFDFETFFSSEVHCEIVTTNCLTGEAEYMTEREDEERLLKMVRASCSLPLISPIVKIDEIPYMDGGMADSIPLERGFSYGNEKIVVVLTKDEGYYKKPMPKRLAQLYHRKYRSYPQYVQTIMGREKVYNEAMRRVEELEKEGKIFVIRPKTKLIAQMERNKQQLQKFYEHGYELMEEEFEGLMEYLKG